MRKWSGTIKYKGYEIKRVVYQDCNNYTVPSLPGNDIAGDLKTAKKWIDQWIYENRPRHTYHYVERYKGDVFQYELVYGGVVLSKNAAEFFLQGDDRTAFFRDCNRAKQHGRSIADVIDEYF